MKGLVDDDNDKVEDLAGSKGADKKGSTGSNCFTTEDCDMSFGFLYGRNALKSDVGKILLCDVSFNEFNVETFEKSKRFVEANDGFVLLNVFVL
jgi:hypothetical protein